MAIAERSAASAVGLGFIWTALGNYRRRAAFVLFLALLDTALASLGVGMVLPVFQALLEPDRGNTVLDRLFPALAALAPDARLAWVAAGTVLVFLLKAAVSLATVTASQGLLLRLRMHWVDTIGARYLHGPYLRLVARKQGELLNDWFNETLAASRFFQSTLARISSTALACALVVLGLLVDWRAMAILLAGGTLIVLLVRRLMYDRAASLSGTKLAINQAFTAAMAEDLAQAREIKLLRAEDVRLRHLSGLGDALRSVLLRGAVLGEAPAIVGEFIAVLALMAFVVGGVALMRLPPQEVLPMLAFFFVAFYRLIGAVSRIMSARVKALNELHSVVLVDRLTREHADAEQEVRGGLPIETIDSDIRLVGLGFRYGDGQAALDAVDAVVPRGRTTLLLGASGAGKSTLLDLLLRLIPAGAGRVEANGRDASDFDLIRWRACFGYVSQEAALFNGSLRMNLCLACPQADDAMLVAACRLAGVHDFIASLPQGYDTPVGDRGVTLSGGQRKRIAIARALVGRPSVLILDEATAAFERSLEREILGSLRAAMPGLTLIQVTHRLDPEMHADWVIALEGGRLAVTGPWDAARRSLLGGIPEARPSIAGTTEP